jgi:hypothetical protein
MRHVCSALRESMQGSITSWARAAKVCLLLLLLLLACLCDGACEQQQQTHAHSSAMHCT